MDNRIKDAFDAIQTPERLKRLTKAHLRKKTFDYGRNVLRQQMHRRRIAAGLLSLTVVLTGAGLWFLPATSIGVEINPSVELKVNALDRVIALEGRNSDGIALAKEIDVTGMAYDDAMQRILLSKGLETYLEQDSTIVITVVGGGSETHGEEMLSRVLCRAYNIAEEENISYYQVDRNTVKAAKESNLCIPRYLAWKALQETNPDITPEDIKQIPMQDILTVAQKKILDNPCGE